MFVKILSLLFVTSIAHEGGHGEFEKVDRHEKHLTKADRFCQRLNGPASYCKYWQTKPVCEFGDQPCRPEDCHESHDSHHDRKTTKVLRPEIRLTKVDRYCQRLNGPASYCKYWQTKPVCEFGDQPCRPEDCHESHDSHHDRKTTKVLRPEIRLTKVDRYCQRLNGPASYCKYWQTKPVCEFGDQPCRLEDCHESHDSHHDRKTTKILRPEIRLTKVDRYCQRLNGPSSYCKYWQTKPVCEFGDQPCRLEDCHESHDSHHEASHHDGEAEGH